MILPDIVEIKDFPSYYVDKDGVIYSTKKNGGFSREMTKMKLKEDKDGYLEVGLYRNKKRYWRRVHRLVASAFIPNPNHLPQINHKDGNVKNNHIDNLEWCTAQENTIHSYVVLKRNPSITMNKPIYLFDKTTKEAMYFNSIRDCAFFLHMSYEHLGRLLNGEKDISKWRKGKRYTIKYLEVEDVTTIPEGSNIAV